MQLRWLKPSRPAFYELFSAAAQKLIEGAQVLDEIKRPDPNYESISDRMRDLEHASDAVTHDLIQTLNTTFVTPFDRSDIYRLSFALDDVMDHMEATANLMHLYHFDQLGPLPDELLAMIDVTSECAAVTAEALPRLRTMKDLERYWIEINRLENEGDKHYRKLVALLFNGELDALTVMKLKEVTDQLEEAVDAFEAVAHTIESIVVKES